MQRRIEPIAGLALCLLPLLGACSMAPDYTPPATTVPAAYKEIPPGWVEAQPQDDADKGRWWMRFNDPVLNDLEERLARSSPTLDAALARYQAAIAEARRTGANLFPSLSAGADISKERWSARRPNGSSAVKFTDVTVGGALDYEVDLWGRVRDNVSAGKADAQAAAADLASAKLSLQASLADSYFELRGLDAEAALLRETADAYGRALDLTRTRHEGGIASGLDVSRAGTVLADARAMISDVARRRALAEHAIAVLIGEMPSGFSITPAEDLGDIPPVVMQSPSDLLQRRPDIAAAERRIYAANARIGVARAALFPSILLGASGGWEATGGKLISTPSSFWSLGPLSLLANIFDGGRRRAEISLSKAQYEEAAAQYQAVILNAFREVEDNIAATRYLAEQSQDSEAAAKAARRTQYLALTRYHDGASDYLDVVTAQTSALSAERQAIAVRTSQYRASIALVRAFGGGF